MVGKIKSSLRADMEAHLRLVGNATVTAMSIALGVSATKIRNYVYSNPDLFRGLRDARGYVLRVELVKRKNIHTHDGADDANDLREEG